VSCLRSDSALLLRRLFDALAASSIQGDLRLRRHHRRNHHEDRPGVEILIDRHRSRWWLAFLDRDLHLVDRLGGWLAVLVTASYIMCAVIAALALIKPGVPACAEHMLIFYYAVLPEVSPLTPLSPFAAATLTRADPYVITLQSWMWAIWVTIGAAAGMVALALRLIGVAMLGIVIAYELNRDPNAGPSRPVI
jgi:hypothetical protein